jgi:antitoxin component YwqK of YwqJK toxin-antitoxin module
MKFYHWLLLFLTHILLFACEKSQPHFKWDDKAFSYQHDILFYQGKPFSGVLDTFFPNHQKSSERVYNQGKLEGWETQWYENGRLSEKRFYQNNQKFGHHIAFWEMVKNASIIILWRICLLVSTSNGIRADNFFPYVTIINKVNQQEDKVFGMKMENSKPILRWLREEDLDY